MQTIPLGLENGHVSLLGRIISYIWNFNWIWFGTKQFPGNHVFYYEMSRLFSFAVGASALILLFKVISNRNNSSLSTKIYLIFIFSSTLTYYGLNSSDPTSSFPIISYPTVLLALIPLWIYIKNYQNLTRVVCIKIFLLSILAASYYELNLSLFLTFVFLVFWKRRKSWLPPFALLLLIYALLFMYSSSYSGTNLNFSVKVFFVIINAFYSSIPIVCQILMIANSRSEFMSYCLLLAMFLSSLVLCYLLFRKFKEDLSKTLECIGIRYEGIQLVTIFLVNVLIIQSSTSKSQIELIEVGRVYTANPYLHLFWLALIGSGVVGLKNSRFASIKIKNLAFSISIVAIIPIFVFNAVAVNKASEHFVVNVGVLQDWDQRSHEFCSSLEKWNREDWPDYYRKEFTINISQSAAVFLGREC